MNRLAFAALILGFLVSAAEASQQAVTAGVKWKAMDSCTRQAQAAFPDFTAEANAKRDARLKECLEGQNLPPREPVAAPR
jgi:hypothetical protein